MKTLEEKANAHAEKIFSPIAEKYKTAPWPEFKDALAQIFLAGATEALAGQWRSVKDELPKEGAICLCRVALEPDDIPSFMTLRFDGIEEWKDPTTKETHTIPSWIAEWYSLTSYEVGDEVTHWMPIPEPPKTESE